MRETTKQDSTRLYTVNMNDILNNKSLKATPHKVPEGYFEGLQKSLKKHAQAPEKAFTWKRLTPYVSMAAMFASIFALGTFFLDKGTVPATENEVTVITEEYYPQYAEVMTEDDIIEYLIYSDIELEELY